MFTPAELIEALQRRLRRTIRPLPKAQALPPAWQGWLDSVRDRAGPGSSARADALVAVLARRAPRPRPPVELLSGWAAFLSLWRQQWEPPRRDERGLRISARAASLLLHLGLALALSWLMHARFVLMPPSDAQRGEHVIEVEFIGRGTPEEDGGGAPPDPATVGSEPLPVVEPVPSPSAVAPLSEPQPAAQATVEAEPLPEPPVPVPAPVEQPLEVTETPLPDGPFQLPPVRPLEIPSSQTPEVQLDPRSRDIVLAETRELSAPPVQPAETVRHEVAQPEVEVVEREVALTRRDVLAADVPVPEIPPPEPQRDAQQARVRDIPMRPATAPVDPVGPVDGADREASAQTDAAPARAPEPSDPGPGAGPAQVQREGGWATPQREDDWGAATRDRPGGQAGTASLFNPDGSPRLPPGSGRVGGGLPPGTITEDYEKIDRMGTWLKRPPTDYEPTSFDRFWVPHENLLQEWVRRSVRTVLIPIPGTSKSIRCDVITLAVAGGCSIIDPNLQDDPAGARPPPDVPFRPELHEDQEGLTGDGVPG